MKYYLLLKLSYWCLGLHPVGTVNFFMVHILIDKLTDPQGHLSQALILFAYPYPSQKVGIHNINLTVYCKDSQLFLANLEMICQERKHF